jgi:diguanylate cyclase
VNPSTGPNGSAAVSPGHGEAALVRLLTWVALALSIVVALAGPVGYVWLRWSAQQQDVAITARLHAAFVMQAIGHSANDWRRDAEGLLDTRLVDQPLPELRRLVDLDGRFVTGSEGSVDWPVVHTAVPLVTSLGPVGQVELSRSMRPVLGSAWLPALLSGAIGLAVYATLRMLPVRLLRRVLDALAREQSRRRRELEEYVHVLFAKAVDGIVVFDATGRIRSCNPRAADMLGLGGAAVEGEPLERWIEPPPRGFSVGHSETVACRGDIRFPCDLTVSAIPVGDRDEQYIAILRDLTERRQAEQRQMRLANYDSLTGLPNRSLFRERLARAMDRARRDQRQLALMFLDLDRFKLVNDSLGHDAGDKLLKHVAQVLGDCLRDSDHVARWTGGVDEAFTVARLGGDEFTVVAEGLTDADQAAGIATRMMRALQQPFFVGREEIVVTTSLGLTLFPAEDVTLDELLKQADMAMYRAKESGRNAFQFYSEAMNADAAARLHLETRLRHALEREDFVLHFQPKALLRGGEVTGVEALLRWQPEGGALVSPDRFIRVLEETGLIVGVGDWVLRTACAQAMAWQRAGLPPLRMAVNLSARQLRQPDLAARVAGALRESGLPPHLLELELTESMLMDGDEFQRKLKTLSDLGVQLAIDDFGTGYSSLAYLKRFNVNTLKVDRSFVNDVPGDPEDCAITSAVIALARSLKLRVVAEGVETEDQAEFLRREGCDEVQGWLLCRALPSTDLQDWLVARHGRAERAERNLMSMV